MSQVEVEQAALQLPIQARAALVQKLLESLKPPQPSVGLPNWVGLGASNAQLSTRDEEILKAECK
jgi:hypothetical protein